MTAPPSPDLFDVYDPADLLAWLAGQWQAVRWGWAPWHGERLAAALDRGGLDAVAALADDWIAGHEGHVSWGVVIRATLTCDTAALRGLVPTYQL